MKTTVSTPDDAFDEAERLTQAMNRVVDEIGGEADEFTQRASRRLLEQVEW